MMYNSLNRYFRETFHTKGYKIALCGNMTCPNRDGTLGTRGCLFCSGAGEFAQSGASVTEQIESAIGRVEMKNPNGVYIAYFQDHTNTYAEVPYLRALFTEAIMHPRVAVLSIATRPDCLPEEVLALLASLAKIKPVWVELGLQTCHDQTANAIRRAYPTALYDAAVKKLHNIGVQVITHLIIGLPGETPEMLYESVRHVARAGTDGVKFHLLHVLRDTDLCDAYLRGTVSTLSFPEYAALLTECLRILPPHIVVHRITGDGDKRTLVAPLWSADKKHVLNALRAYFEERHLVQGEACFTQNTGNAPLST